MTRCSSGQEERDEQDGYVRFRILEQAFEHPPAAHVVGYHHQYACQACHRDKFRQRHQEDKDKQQHYGMDNARYGCLSSVIDVGHGAGNGSCGRDSAENRRYDIGNALCH